MVQVADTDSDVVRGIEVHLISTAWIKTCQFRVWSRRRQAASAILFRMENLQVIPVGFLIVVGFVALTAVVSQAMTDKQ